MHRAGTREHFALEHLMSTSAARSTPRLEQPQTVRARLERALGCTFSHGNRIEPLRNGDEIFPAMLTAIEAAEHRVELVTFIYWKGDIAQEFASALARQAAKGVTVRVLLDAYGSARMAADLIDEMSDAGADLRLFRPIRRRDFFKLTSRTHRKVLVCDRQVAFTGGVGIAEEWEGDARNPQEWRETHFRLTGPVVDGLHGAFMDNWGEADQFKVDDHPMRLPDVDGEALTHVICSTGGAASSEMRRSTLALIAAAQRTLILVTAYFVPDEELIDALVTARKRGVDIAVMLPGSHSDWRLCNLASGQEIADLVEHGVRVHLYERTMLHAKIMIVDSEACLIGSPNLNQRSMNHDDEVGVLAIDAGLAQRLTDDFQADLAVCEPFDAARWRDRSPMQRVVEEAGRRLRSRL